MDRADALSVRGISALRLLPAGLLYEGLGHWHPYAFAGPEVNPD